MKCIVCRESNIVTKYKPFLTSGYVHICSQECYAIYCKEYSLAKLDVTITEMEKRLKLHKKKGGRNTR